MNKEKIRWCVFQKRGVNLTELKPHLSKAYMEEAEETLENVFSAKGKWKTITAYYACYNALYSLLMKCGISSEIHDCTLELMHLFNFSEENKKYMIQLKNDRIQAQYYLKKILLKDEEEVKKFVITCKGISSQLHSDAIEKMREEIRSLQKTA